MAETTLPDTEGALRAYLRADADVTAALGSRIFFGVDDPSDYPVATLTRIGGGLGGGSAEGLHDVALIQLDAYGDVHDKASAFTAMQALVQACVKLDQVGGYSDARARLYGADVQSWAFLPDNERARYTATVQVIAGPPSS
jgi:hypothetical protein